jgi:Family of unknown function (DUF6353)
MEKQLITVPMPDLVSKAIKIFKSNSPEILTAFGVSGVLTTSYLVGKASFKASHILVGRPKEEEFKEKVKLVWKCYIPAGISGVLTIGCIVGASKVNGRRTAAAVTAYSLTERAFSEYREKVVEELGKGKEKKIRDEIAQDRVAKTPPGSREVIVVGTGHVLCCELYTHRYFRSDMETLRKAQNDINARVNHELYVCLDEFYDLIGLPYTANSINIGWDSDRLMELEFSTVISEDGEPCIAFDYNYIKPLH